MSNKTMQAIKYIFCRFVLRRKYLTAKEKYFNTKITFKIEDAVGRTIYKNGTYEDDLTKYLINNLNINKGEVILDIGANIGWYSLILANITNTSIYSFEPDHHNFKLLLQNINQNKFKNIHAVNKAIANENTTMKLYKYKESNLGRHSLLHIHDGATEQVDTVTVDSFLSEKQLDPTKVKFVKIDIEGYEYFALLGATKILESSPLILLEHSPHFMKTAGYDHNLLLDLLQTNGFKPFLLKNGNLNPVDINELQSLKDQIEVFWKK